MITDGARWQIASMNTIFALVLFNPLTATLGRSMWGKYGDWYADEHGVLTAGGLVVLIVILFFLNYLFLRLLHFRVESD